MIGNIKKLFPPKTGMQKKQVLQDPVYVKDVEIHAAYCLLCKVMSKTLKILKQGITDFNEFIYFLSKTCTNYNVDSNTKSSNYSKIDLNPWFTLNYNRVQIKTSN